jgi:hypothetical protein
MDVTFFDRNLDVPGVEPDLEIKQVSISEIESLINLVRKYGYQDCNGVDYLFEYAQVEPEGVCIYLSKKEK